MTDSTLRSLRPGVAPEGPSRADWPSHRTFEDVVEVPLLLLGWQMSALEQEAHQRGLTAGEMVRHLLDDFIRDTSRL